MFDLWFRRANPRPRCLAHVLVVRNEADVLAASLAHQLAQGVDVIVAADNGSTDATRDILRRFATRGRLVWHEEPADNYAQGEWMTRLVRRARQECGADWVLLGDADEFWTAPNGSDLKEVIARGRAPVLVKPLINCVRVLRPGEPDEGPLAACDFAAVGRPQPRPAADADEAEARSWIYGTPDVKICSAVAVLREVEVGHGVRTAWWAKSKEATDLTVWHAPIRSYAQFERKVRFGAAALARNPAYGPGTGYHWRRWLDLWQRGQLPDEYARLTIRSAELAARCESGILRHPIPRFWASAGAE